MWKRHSRGMKGQPHVVSLQPDSLAQIWDDIRRVAAALGIADKGEEVIGRLKGRMQRAGQEACVTVACIEWMEPLMAAGNWTPELIELAGGVNLFGEAGRHSPWMEWQQLVDADPDVIVIAPCGFDLARTGQEVHWMTSRRGWNKLRARVYLADGNQYFNRPGPRVVETFRMLCEMLHPEQFAPTLRGHAWRPVG